MDYGFFRIALHNMHIYICRFHDTNSQSVDKKRHSGVKLSMISSASVYFGYYRTGRFVFAISLLIAFHTVGLLAAAPKLFYILSAFCLVALLRLIMSRWPVGHLDFILDIVFISAMAYVSVGSYSYITLFYLFPVFFSSLYVKKRLILIYPLIATFLYAVVFGIKGDILIAESLLNILLHALSFSLIAFAASHLNERMARQEEYIMRLEREKIIMQGYERLYRISADLAHELRNPLASISAAVQFMREGKSSSDFIDMLGQETSRLTNLVNDFLMFSRPSDAPREEIDLGEMLRTIAERYGQGVGISNDIEEDIHVMANRVYLDAALSNIVRNAAEAASNSIHIAARNIVNLDYVGSMIFIEIEDDGPGIPESLRDRIFEPFVTTKNTGTGLGLALAYRVITSLGGNIVAGSSQLGGARMALTLPAEGVIKKMGEVI
jgi:signal transduction histidine kinase